MDDPKTPGDKAWTRRAFLGGLGAAGLAGHRALASGGALGPAGAAAGEAIENEELTASFDARSGRFHVGRKGGAPLLSGAVARARTGRGLRATSDAAYRHEVEEGPVDDRLGRGRQLAVRSRDGEGWLDLELRIALYQGRRAVVVEAIARNVSSGPLVVESLEPVCALDELGGRLSWPDVTKVLTNGPMYHDAGAVLDFTAVAMEKRRSWWNVGLFSGYEKEGLCCGFIQNDVAQGRVSAWPAGKDAISLLAEGTYQAELVLAPGASITSNRFMVNIGSDPYIALEDYAQAMGDLHGARPRSIVNGWCDWFYAFADITEDEVVRIAEFTARVLLPLGLDTIQVDEGFQRWHGDWEGNERFPHGMKWLAERIRGLGLKPGIWLAPYVISEPTEVFRKHPEWLLRKADGSPRRVGPWPAEDSEWARNESPKRYGLDITHPGAAEWFRGLIETVARRWGYQMIKIDFVEWSLLSADRYHDPGVTRAAAYRKGFEILRQAAGPEVHLLDCGPGPVTVGLLDSMRIELDQPPVLWKQYFLESASSAPAAAKRYYFHKRTWINDDDHVCLGLLATSQAQAAATIVALSGGNLISGDRLTDLDPTRLEILKKVIPSSGEAARPIDLFDTDRHSVFAVRMRRPFGEWTVLGIFNIGESSPMERRLPLRRLGLDPGKTYVAYDFWKEKLHGEVRGELAVKVAPASVTLLSLHEVRGIPQVISTDRHVLQGAVEIEDVSWDAASNVLSGVSLGPEGTAHNVAVYLPEPHPWIQGGPFLFHDFPGYTLKLMDERILRVRVRFDGARRVAWKVDLKKFLGGA
jgi:melibiase-like protein